MVNLDDIKCKYCNSSRVFKFGHYRGDQRYFCSACNHKFTLSDTLPKGKIPIKYIADALGMYFRGMSISKVAERFEDEYDYPISSASVYNWVMRYSKQAKEKAKEYTPNVGDVWIADEAVIRVEDGKGYKLWYWDILDAETRFLLASHVSRTRTMKDAQKLIEPAKDRAGKTPKAIYADKLAAYIDGVEPVFGADPKHVHSKSFGARDSSTNLIGRLHGSLKDIREIMQGMKETKTAEALLDGWLVYYNFFRPHESLGGKTPAEKAGIKFPYHNWEDIVRSNQLKIEVSDREKYPRPKRYRARLAKSTLNPNPKRVRKNKTGIPSVGIIK